MITLGIETSCDETSVAVLENESRISGNLIATQIEAQQIFGGVVPKIASRKHLAGATKETLHRRRRDDC